MIKSINPVGKYTMAMNAQAPGMYINHQSGLQSVGNVRYNTVSNVFEVFDGNMWMQMSVANAQIGLTPEAEGILDWARAKMAQEERIQKLATEHPGIRDLKEKLDIMLALVDKDPQL
jgi:hypothetical protein